MVLPSRSFIALIGLSIALVGSCVGYWKGHSAGEDRLLSQQVAHQQKYSERTKKVTTEVVTVYKDRIKTIYVKGDTIIKKVPVYVTKEDDSRAVINNGFVRLWNSDNKMSVPGPARSSDGEASLVVLSDIAAQHSRESIICHATEQQLLSLQDWVRKQSKIH